MNRFADKEYYRKPKDYRFVSGTETKYNHIEAFEKVTGAAKYAGDYMAPDMYTAKVKKSPYPRAKIISIDTSKAEALPGVKCVLTGRDLPERMVQANIEEVLCRRMVRMIDDPVAAVCAVDEATAQAAVDLIEVVYEELPAVFEPEEAMKPGAIDVQGFGKDDGNISLTCHQVGGNDGKTVDDEFAKAAYISHRDFRTHRIQHAPIEPHASYATYDPQKELFTVVQSTTMAFADQKRLATFFGMEESHFHIIRPYVGGAFGVKSNTPFSMYLACEFARRTLHPVRFVLTREEEFTTMHGRHPFLIHIDTAFDKDGRILAKKTDQILHGGAYPISGAAVNLSALWCTFPYKIEAVDFLSRRAFTNTSPNGAMRGYTACQVEFGGDLDIQYTAEEMGIDPIEMRLRNAMEPGYKAPNGTEITSCSFKETLRDVAEYMRWSERKDSMPAGQGIGFSGTAFVSGTAQAIFKTPSQVQTNATVRVDWNGVVSLYSNCHDNGQGADTVMTMIVAEELGLDMNEVHLVQPSTFHAGYDSGAYGSRVTFLGGNAVRNAAVDVKRKLLEYVACKWDTDPHLLDIVDHTIINRDVSMGKGDLVMTWKDAVYGYMAAHGGDELIGIGSYFHRTHPNQFSGAKSNYAPSYCFSSSACELEVDMETGLLDIKDFFFAHDCGQALNKRAVEGQLEGSIYSGLGYTIYEELKLKNGKMLNSNFRDYRMMTALDMPPIHTKFDYAPDPDGPFGAKECGEGTTAPIAPAVANAIHHATGLLITELPLDPEHVWRMLRDQGKIKTGKEAL